MCLSVCLCVCVCVGGGIDSFGNEFPKSSIPFLQSYVNGPLAISILLHIVFVIMCAFVLVAVGRQNIPFCRVDSALV